MKYYTGLVSVEVKLSMCISWIINTQPQATFVTGLHSTRQTLGGLVFSQTQQGFLSVLFREAVFGSADGQVRAISQQGTAESQEGAQAVVC